MQRRRTKIVATLGPATSQPDQLEALLNAGVDMFRLNFSHGTEAEHEQMVTLAREAAARAGTEVAILGDLQGPKIRIGRFADGPVHLSSGDAFTLDASMGQNEGHASAVGLTYKGLPKDVNAGDVLLLADGQLEFKVTSVEGEKVHCKVLLGGELSDSKGINRQGGGLSAAALTHKDVDDIRTIARLGLDYMAVSFPRDASDIEHARALLREAGGEGRLVAKIERAEAVEKLDEIIEASDVVMIARGDLGVEIGFAELPGVQKMIVARAREGHRVVITATQMMESMISHPIPTRAEVSDVANAVMDGTDAVMLSGETAIGAYPVEAVVAMARTCEGAERARSTQVSGHRLDARFKHVDEAIAMATMYVANHLDVSAIIALTESGATALWMSRIRSGIPIFAFTRHESTRRRVKLYRGVYPIQFDITDPAPGALTETVVAELRDRGIVKSGEQVLFTRGDLSGVSGGTNTMKIIGVR